MSPRSALRARPLDGHDDDLFPASALLEADALDVSTSSETAEARPESQTAVVATLHDQLGNGLVQGALSGDALGGLGEVVRQSAGFAAAGLHGGDLGATHLSVMREQIAELEQARLDEAARDVPVGSGEVLPIAVRRRMEAAF